MLSPASLKQEFLKNWIKSLKIYRSSIKNMSFIERKKAIKLSSDIAMASTTKITSSWSRAIILNGLRNENENFRVSHMLNITKKGKKILLEKSRTRQNIVKKIFKRRHSFGKRRIARNIDIDMKRNNVVRIAKKLSRKRTELLKKLVPGGKFMDEVCLFEETLDYILSLQAQVEVMRNLVDVSNVIMKHA